jgi:hypothetical protein
VMDGGLYDIHVMVWLWYGLAGVAYGCNLSSAILWTRFFGDGWWTLWHACDGMVMAW